MKTDNLIGKTVTNFYLDKTLEQGFAFKINDKIHCYYLGADCCSNSYICSIEGLQHLLGSEIMSIEKDNEAVEPSRKADDDGYDCLSPHILVIKTVLGDFKLRWENNSNGYYDGWIEDTSELDNLVEQIADINVRDVKQCE